MSEAKSENEGKYRRDGIEWYPIWKGSRIYPCDGGMIFSWFERRFFVMLIRSTTRYPQTLRFIVVLVLVLVLVYLFIVIRTPYIVFDSPPEADFGCATAAVVGVHAELNDAAA